MAILYQLSTAPAPGATSHASPKLNLFSVQAHDFSATPVVGWGREATIVGVHPCSRGRDSGSALLRQRSRRATRSLERAPGEAEIVSVGDCVGRERRAGNPLVRSFSAVDEHPTWRQVFRTIEVDAAGKRFIADDGLELTIFDDEGRQIRTVRRPYQTWEVSPDGVRSFLVDRFEALELSPTVFTSPLLPPASEVCRF